MNPFDEFSAGITSLMRGFDMIRRPGLRRYVIVPLLINMLVIVAVMSLFGWQLGQWLDVWLAGLPAWLHWLETVLWWVGFILAILLFCYFFTYLAMLVASPFIGILSAHVEKRLTGREPETGMTLPGEMLDGISGALRLLWYSLTRTGLLALVTLILLFIPVVNTLIPIMWFLFGAYLMAFEYLDAPLANRGMAFRDKVAYVKSRPWRHIGFGSAVTLLTAVPVINLTVLPAAVVGATLLYLEEDAKPLLSEEQGSGTSRPRTR